MKCKNCKRTTMPLQGLKDFCSDDCKKAYRMAYQAKWLKKKRSVSNSYPYLSINSQNVDSGKAHEKPIYKGQNGGLGLSEDNFSIKEGESMAREHCPEYERKEREGYCIKDGILHEIECEGCSKLKDTLMVRNT